MLKLKFEQQLKSALGEIDSQGLQTFSISVRATISDSPHPDLIAAAKDALDSFGCGDVLVSYETRIGD